MTGTKYSFPSCPFLPNPPYTSKKLPRWWRWAQNLGCLASSFLYPPILYPERGHGAPLASEGFVLFFLGAPLFTISLGGALPGMNSFGLAQGRGEGSLCWRGVTLSRSHSPQPDCTHFSEEQCASPGVLPEESCAGEPRTVILGYKCPGLRRPCLLSCKA